jgi:redox-sensitive bicupin YhaK (pirin superfamily)
MPEKLHRRKFIQRLHASAAAALAWPFVQTANAAEAELARAKAAEEAQNPILKISQMGFQWETADPFLFCVHHEDHFPKGNGQLGPATSLEGRSIGDDFIIKDGWRMYHGTAVPGFPGHPHRGFETVTVVRKGMVDHADSLGAAGRYGDGDVQWMTAGKGVQHSEMFPLLRQDRDNPLELFQIWLNLPRKNKMVEPHFKMLWRESIPNYQHRSPSGKMTQVEVIAGRLHQHQAPAPPPGSWAADPANEVGIWNIRMEAGAEWVLPQASPGINRYLYCYIGKTLKIGERAIPAYCSVQVRPEHDLRLRSGDSEARILVLQGRPINEPVIQYGPFVMNTKAEINQAFEDYHKTRFGGWPWPKPDQVHDGKLGRFAIHADGRKELKS